MTLTLLLDLDDTLIVNPINAFLEAYLKAFAKHLNGKIDPNRFVQQLLASTEVMIRNDSAAQTLEGAFDASFYPSLGFSKIDLQEIISAFYQDVYPTLRSVTSPKPEAIQFVEQALQRGFRVAVATNPLFPRTAILQRLAWAGLSPSDYPFDLISSYETFHFAKPNPAFFTEVMGQLGWPTGPAVMVGNSLSDDILPAAQAGLRTYYLEDSATSSNGSMHIPGASGTLENLIDWLDRLDPEGDTLVSAEPPTILNILKSTPAALSTIGFPLVASEWSQRPSADEWSLTEITCHLRDVEREVNLERLRLVQQESNPFIAGQDTDAWANERQYRTQNGPQALTEFIRARIDLISILNTFREGDWDRITRHAIFGPTPVRELISFIAAHDRTHLQQAKQTLQMIQPAV